MSQPAQGEELVNEYISLKYESKNITLEASINRQMINDFGLQFSFYKFRVESLHFCEIAKGNRNKF